LSADTAFYVVSTDSIFKSDFTKANVYLANLNPDFTALLDNGVPGKVTFTGNNAMTSWDWSFGDLSTGNGKVVNNIYGVSDTYDVKLIVTNGIGCKDSITKQVVVDNFVTASGSLNLQKGEYFNAYPNPSNGSYNLELALNTTEAIAVKIFDAIGNMVFANKEVPKAIDLSAVPTGIYILQVQTGSRILTQKLYLGTK
jgi:PKD repeat protein